MAITVWLHYKGRRFKLPVDADHVQITGSEIRAIRGSDIHAFSHRTPRDVHILQLGKRMQKGTWRAIDRGRFHVRGALDHSEIAGRTRRLTETGR